MSLHGRHFADDILVYIFLNGNFSHIHIIVSLTVKLYINSSSDNGLVPIRRHLITCANDDNNIDAIFCHINAREGMLYPLPDPFIIM